MLHHNKQFVSMLCCSLFLGMGVSSQVEGQELPESSIRSSIHVIRVKPLEWIKLESQPKRFSIKARNLILQVNISFSEACPKVFLQEGWLLQRWQKGNWSDLNSPVQHAAGISRQALNAQHYPWTLNLPDYMLAADVLPGRYRVIKGYCSEKQNNSLEFLSTEFQLEK